MFCWGTCCMRMQKVPGPPSAYFHVGSKVVHGGGPGDEAKYYK